VRTLELALTIKTDQTCKIKHSCEDTGTDTQNTEMNISKPNICN